MNSPSAATDTPLDFEIEGLQVAAKFERFVDVPDFRGVPAKILDIPETIGQLGYGSHQFFRYYGKFPSFVGRELIDRFAMPGRAVLDCYSGSGTTQVEAQIRGFASYGVDINPLAVLASNVKTQYFDYADLTEAFSKVTSIAQDPRTENYIPVGMTSEKLTKWFSDDVLRELGCLHEALLTLPESPARSFLIVCYLAIVRRCSFAFDGEVRPHINKAKPAKLPFVAFNRKFKDMLAGLRELDSMRPPGVPSQTVLGDNRIAATYEPLTDPVGLVVSHPPYLNSFNYLQVFSLEFAWAEGFDEVWQNYTMPEIRRLEQKAWPATDPKIVTGYYDAIASATHQASQLLVSGGSLAIVVGDATIHGVLEPVHTKIWERTEELGLEPSEIWYRTTHYGIGKYAYSDRADYHGEAEKKDAIMFFKKR